MKQLVIKKGLPLAVDVSEPQGQPGRLLVATHFSCISPGTEMSSVHGSGKSLMRRVMDQPDKALEALSRIRSKGVGALWEKARSTMEREATCGYSASGLVLDVGPSVVGFHTGMRVAMAGAGHANHAEICSVPQNLVIPVPDDVDLADASTVALGAIAMQGVRRAEVSLGECVAVIGCGALGMLALQMLKASGCRVLVADLDPRRLDTARNLGADAVANPREEDVVARATHWSGGHGVDAVLVMASTSSSEPLSQAFQMCRRKGRVVLVGIAGTEYKRSDMYQKELDFRISTSYGPGRYDDHYELDGHDYPYGYVRWTEKRNMEAYLQLIACGAVKVSPMIEIRRPLAAVDEAYAALDSPAKPLMAILEYSQDADTLAKPPIQSGSIRASGVEGSRISRLAVIGGGSFFNQMHLPILKAMPGAFEVTHACSRTGASARQVAARVPGCRDTTNPKDLFDATDVDAVLIATRHDTHGRLAAEAIRAGKSVMLEKPMCLTPDEFHEIEAALQTATGAFMVGYNRRYSPFAQAIQQATAGRSNPLMLQYIMNAGHLPAGHWTHGPEGGGRLMGEACHLVDLFRFLVGHPVVSVSCEPLRSKADAQPTDNFSLTLGYGDGSVANLIYTAQGPRTWPKEHLKVFWDEKAAMVHDYLTMEGHGMKGLNQQLKDQDKGHRREWEVFHQALRAGNRFPIPWDELSETWRVCHVADSLCRKGTSI